MGTPLHTVGLPAGGGRGEFMVRLGVSTATRTGDEEVRRQCVARLGVSWEPRRADPAGDEEVRRQCVARLGVRWSHAPGTAAQDPGAHKRDSWGLMPGGEEEGWWPSDTPASTASSLAIVEHGVDTAQDQTADGGFAVVPTWLDDERRMAHEAEDADRRWRDTVDENRRVRDQLGAAQREASAWRRAAEDASSRWRTLEVRADEADRFVLRCSVLLQEAADADGVREEELGRARDDAKDALDRAAKAEEEQRVLRRRAQLLTTKVAEADATSALLRERLRHAKESYEENLAQAARDVDMRTEELNSMQDRFDEVAAENARMERQASK